jgi:hypothetical protein
MSGNNIPQYAYNALTLTASIWTAYCWLNFINAPLAKKAEESTDDCEQLSTLITLSTLIGSLSLGRAYYLAFPRIEEAACLKSSTCFNILQQTTGIATSFYFAGIGAYSLLNTLKNVVDSDNMPIYLQAVIGVLSGMIFAVA